MLDGLLGPAEGLPTEKSPGRRSGVVTLLFTDVVGSTALKQRLGDRAGVELMEQHHALVRQVLTDFPRAEEIATAGDSFLILFPVPSEAVKYALLLQQKLIEFNRGQQVPVRDRIGLHMGEVLLQELGAGPRSVHGIQVDTCSRVMSLAQAGQILMTRPVFDNARQSLKGEELEGAGLLTYLNHGRFELKGVEEPVEICEVRAAAAGLLSAPSTSEKARYVADEGETVLGWRPAAGQTVPKTKWVLEENLGEGGFGEVWKARHQSLNETRVFKFCFRADRVRSLKREVTLFRLLKERVGEHPNIVKLYDINFDQPPFFLEEEYVEGKDLRTWCEAQGGVENVPVETRLEIVAQAAEALQAAHEAGIIHRDVKPGNILIGGRSEVGEPTTEKGQRLPSSINYRPLTKLTDFGIGQVISVDVLKDVTSTGFTQTTLQAGTSAPAGTQFYMGPELLSGNTASTRSDIYSLGVVLYQLLVGDFKRPVPTDWADDIPDPLLREDLHHCFAGKPGDRFPAAGLLAKNLRALPERRTELERRAAEKAALERAAYRRGMVRTAAIATFIFAVIAALAWQARSNALAKFRQATQIRSTTVRLVLANGLSPASRGDWLSAGLWFSEAFVLDEAFQKPVEAGLNRQTHRLRINSLLHQSPRLEQMWFDDASKSGGFGPGGQDILLGGNNGFRLYSVNSGQEVSPVVAQGDQLAKLSPDGRRVVSGGDSSNSVLSVWDTRSGGRLFDLRVPGGDSPFRGECKDFQFSGDGQWIAAPVLGPGGRVVVWNAATGRVQHELTYADAPNVGWTNKDLILLAAFDSSGERLVTTGTDARAVVWEWQTGRPLQVLKGHRSWVYSACFAKRHTNWLVTCSFDWTACLWDLNTGHPTLRVEHEGDGIRDVQFSPDDAVFVTGGLDFTVRLWDSETGRLVPPLLRNNDRVMQIQWSPDATRLAAITWDGVARVWHFEPGTPDVKLTTTDWSLDGRFALNHDAAGVSLKDLAPGGQTVLRQVACTNMSAWCFAGGTDRFLFFAPSASSAHGENQNGVSEVPTRLQLWEFNGNKALGPALEYDPSWSHMTCAPGGRRFAFFSGDEEPIGTSKTNSVLVWDPANPSRTRRFTFPGEGVESVAFDRQGRRMVAGWCQIANGTGVLRLFDLEGAGDPVVLLSSGQRIAHLSFSADGQWLVAACFDKTLDPGDALVWRVPGPGVPFGQPSRLHHLDGVLHAAFSDSGQVVATASEDQTAIVWHQNHGAWQAALRPLRCSGQVFACAFSHNARWLATVSRTPEAQQLGKWSSQLRIWDVAHSEVVSLPVDFSELVTKIEFVAQDTLLLVESWRPPAEPRRWLISLRVNEGSAKELLLRTQLLSAQRSFLSGGAQHLPQALPGRLSGEEALTYATSVGPLRPLTKQDCKELWLYLSQRGSSPQ